MLQRDPQMRGFGWRTVGLLLVARATVAFTPPRLSSPPCARDVARMAGMPLVPYKPPGSDYTQFIDIYRRLYRDRIMLIGSFLDEEQCNNIIAVLLYLKYEDPNKQISLYFNFARSADEAVPRRVRHDAVARLPDLDAQHGARHGHGRVPLRRRHEGHALRAAERALPHAAHRPRRPVPGAGERHRADGAREPARQRAHGARALRDHRPRAPHSQEEMQRDFYLSSSEAVQYGLIDRVLLPTADDKVRYQIVGTGRGGRGGAEPRGTSWPRYLQSRPSAGDPKAGARGGGGVHRSGRAEKVPRRGWGPPAARRDVVGRRA